MKKKQSKENINIFLRKLYTVKRKYLKIHLKKQEGDEKKKTIHRKPASFIKIKHVLVSLVTSTRNSEHNTSFVSGK